MTLILNNDEITELLPMEDCLTRLDETYRELGEGRAISRPRSDIYGPVHDNGRYIFKTMDGMMPRFEVAAIRLNSDVILWDKGPAGIRKDKQPMAAGGKFVGLVLLFSTRNGEPLAIMPDGVIQRQRVACANALGVRYMAPTMPRSMRCSAPGGRRPGRPWRWRRSGRSRKSGSTARPSANRERLAGELKQKLGIDVRAVESAQAAVRGADIVGMATNSVTPVADADWLTPHAHVTCVKELELDDRMLERSAQIIVHTRIGKPANYIIGKGDNPIYDHDPKEALGGEIQEMRAARKPFKVDLTKQADLGELVTGQVQRLPAGGITCFVNTLGMGLPFAALGALAYEKAKDRGMGREIPTDWLLETVHP